MQRVWQELSKHRRENHRRTEVLRYPARPPAGTGTATEDVQSVAMLELFMEAFCAVRQLSSGANVPASMMTAQLREDAALLRRAARKPSRPTKTLLDAAAVYDSALPAPDRRRVVAEHLARFLLERFGTPMQGITAILASVALDPTYRQRRCENGTGAARGDAHPGAKPGKRSNYPRLQVAEKGPYLTRNSHLRAFGSDAAGTVRFKQAEVTRAVRAARASGLKVSGIEWA